MLGWPDPRHAASGKTDARLARQQRGYKKADPNPVRLKPIPVEVLFKAYDLARAAGDAHSLCTADMIWLAFFFLLRTGEYSSPTATTHPFTLDDVHLQIGARILDVATASERDLDVVDHVSLEFRDQKNGHRGERVGHGCSAHRFACPVKVVIRRIKYLRSIEAPMDTYLCAYLSRRGSIVNLRASTITAHLRSALLACPCLDYPAKAICAESLRASGAMALLNEGVDSCVISMIGRWNSDAMLDYLHVQSHTLMRHYAALMINGGTSIDSLLRLRQLHLQARLPAPF